MQSRASSCLLSEAAPFYLGRFPQFSTWNDSEGDSGHVRCFRVSSLACQSTYTPSASEILTLSSSGTDKLSGWLLAAATRQTLITLALLPVFILLGWSCKVSLASVMCEIFCVNNETADTKDSSARMPAWPGCCPLRCTPHTCVATAWKPQTWLCSSALGMCAPHFPSQSGPNPASETED